jgi:hypothetical protein
MRSVASMIVRSLVGLWLLGAASALAIDPPYVGEIVYTAGEATILVLPDGSGPPMSEARSAAGDVVDATVRVRIVGEDFSPHGYFPMEDLWLQWSVAPGTVRGCMQYPSYPGGVFFADGLTNVQGWTEFALPRRGGGHSSGSVTVYLNGMPAYHPHLPPFEPLPLHFVSPDIDGSLTVDLGDLTLFAADYVVSSGVRSDFNVDGTVNLADLATFSQGFSIACEP